MARHRAIQGILGSQLIEAAKLGCPMTAPLGRGPSPAFEHGGELDGVVPRVGTTSQALTNAKIALGVRGRDSEKSPRQQPSDQLPRATYTPSQGRPRRSVRAGSTLCRFGGVRHSQVASSERYSITFSCVSALSLCVRTVSTTF